MRTRKSASEAFGRAAQLSRFKTGAAAALTAPEVVAIYEAPRWIANKRRIASEHVAQSGEPSADISCLQRSHFMAPSFLKTKMIEGIDHERGARQGGNECAGGVEMEAGAERDKQKHEQAENQRVIFRSFPHCDVSPCLTPRQRQLAPRPRAELWHCFLQRALSAAAEVLARNDNEHSRRSAAP